MASQARYRVAKTTNLDGTANYHVLDDANDARPVAEFDTEAEAEARRRQLEEENREFQSRASEAGSEPLTDLDR